MVKYIVRFLLQAETPLFVGSGQSSLLKDALVQKDVNGFPMIPGTSLAGVLRHSFARSHGEACASKIFGDSKGSETGTGSLLKISPALMLLNTKQVSEGLLYGEQWEQLKFRFDNLPIRQHVRISQKGVAEEMGLFDNEVIYKGTRFVFELELTERNENLLEDWESLLKIISSSDFRIGSGTRNGYGSLKVLKKQAFRFDLRTELKHYLDLSPSFADIDWNRVEENSEKVLTSTVSKVKYTLKLTPDPFFIFGSGYDDQDVDNTPLEEEVIKYDESSGKICFESFLVIPGSSIKGAIAHRVAYHFNRKQGIWAGSDQDGLANEAVKELFGDIETSKRAGKIFIDDVFLSQKEVASDKIFNHVAIDRFTGGAIDGALFSEKVSYLKRRLYPDNFTRRCALRAKVS
ncbi:CRISPR-associated protein, TM1792/TM1809 family [Nitritalea halalkaliphila LW7]|uniref:CRISPR-associated protein, TM1792/TM1809 family n=1 Tax=Nitritalea halalkaliphila LW7 TaxID=1189621 RepID=I5BSM1_9BACT|nr:RAMP superfamily CRISPR-associated protein [Nitritalea halalkaliphila]EIM72573.1 CRISPR-associated protein, TM1792/TM1809 family [Nitritalea halalkaliphila LW7]